MKKFISIAFILGIGISSSAFAGDQYTQAFQMPATTTYLPGYSKDQTTTQGLALEIQQTKEKDAYLQKQNKSEEAAINAAVAKVNELNQKMATMSHYSLGYQLAKYNLGYEKRMIDGSYSDVAYNRGELEYDTNAVIPSDQQQLNGLTSAAGAR